MKNVVMFTLCLAGALLLINCEIDPPVRNYTVTYDGNGHTAGTVPVDDNRYTSGETVAVLPAPGLEKNGAEFLGWNSQPDGNGFDYGATFIMGSSPVIIYAKWYTLYNLRNRGPAGGWIFYDKGYYADGWRYLEAAPGDQSQGICWDFDAHGSCDTTNVSYGGGQFNTDNIIAVVGDGNYAAHLCDDLIISGYDDWYLPNGIECSAMYTNLKQHDVGGFSDNKYWTSQESGSAHAWYKRMRDNWSGTDDKRNILFVRAVRSF